MKLRYLAVPFLLLFAIGCKDFIEPSLTKREIILLGPGDNYSASEYNTSFWWETDDDALGYRLQIVSPGFDSVKRLVMDTLIKTNKFNVVMSPGKYEWRVRMENGSSKSSYSKRAFTIYLSSIKEQTVALKSPSGSTITNQANVVYKWESLYGSTRYRIQVDTNSFASDSILVFNSTTTNTELSWIFPKEKGYQWRVRGENDTVQSKWSAVHTLFYDNTPPGQVVLTAPSNSQLVSKPVTLQWNNVAGAVKYQLLITKSDSATAYSSAFPLTLNANSYNFSPSANEKFYWKVRAVDNAGNLGVYSNQRHFTSQ